MRVKLEKDYRQYSTLEQLEQARNVIKAEKEDEETVAGWAKYAVMEALKDTGHCDREILQAEATTARNGRIWDQYGDGTGTMDVWIKATARTSEGFIEIGAYLSDIWQSGVTDYRQHMYIERYGRI